MARGNIDRGRKSPSPSAPGLPDVMPASPAAAGAAEGTAVCRIHWIDSQQGILPSAAAWLLGEIPPGPTADLSGFTVVVPGRAAGHRLLELLIDKAASDGRRIVPPTTVTLGTLPEELYEPARPLADTTTETLCWMAAIDSAAPRDRRLIAPGVAGARLGADDDGMLTDEETVSGEGPPSGGSQSAGRMFDAARMLVGMHRELAANTLSFKDVTSAADDALPGFGDHARWEALSRLEEAYLRNVDGVGCWDRQTARRVAVEQREVDFDGRIVLLATVDVDPLQRKMLSQVNGQIDALVALPAGIGPDPEACFDDFGCIVPDAWRERPLPVPLERVVVVDDTDAQAAAVVDWIGSMAARRAADEITVAAPDDSTVPSLEQRLATAGLVGRYAAGRTMQRSSPWQLVHAIFAWLDRREFATLADLLRCPDCIRLLSRRTGQAMPAAVADRVATRHLPQAIDRDHLAAAAERPDDRLENSLFIEILDAVDAWLAPLQAAGAAIDRAVSVSSADRLTATARKKRTRTGARATPAALPGHPTLAPAWVAGLRAVCSAALEGVEIDRDAEGSRVFARALGALGEQLADMETIPDRLAAAAGSGGLVRLLVSTWGRSGIPPAQESEAIDIVGWLEVALDDAPALAITSCIEGCLPGNAGRDPLLPEPLRQALGLDNAARTAARDAWMLAVAAVREDLLVVVPRCRSDGSPAIPSRLLFRRDPDGVVAAAKRLFATPHSPSSAGPPPVVASRLLVPAPTVLGPASGDLFPAMRVTEFRDYLTCPYRYWLKQRLRLTSAHDDSLELGPGDFGTLIHDCLDIFAKDRSIATSDDGDAIADWLSAALDRIVHHRYGSAAAPAVAVQAELARRRLREFARVQANRTSEGWTIHSTEKVVRSQAFVVDGIPVELSGRIDRIDRHEAHDQWEVLDYKTSAKGKTPEKTHRTARGWIDLQLPLYRHLLTEVEGMPMVDLADSSMVRVGYFNVPAKVEEIRIVTADWSDSDYADADEAARQVVRNVRQGLFWPPNPAAAGSFPEFDGICQTHAIRDDDDAEGEAL